MSSPGPAHRRRRRGTLLSVHCRGIYRQLDVEGATLALGAVHPDPSPVSLDYQLAEGETESRAARAWSSWHLDLSEFPENDFMVFRWDSRAVVAHGEKNSMAGAPGRELEMNRAGGVSHGVLDQVREYALDQTLVARKDRSVVGHRHRGRRLLLLKPVPPFMNQFGEQRGGGHWCERERYVRLLDPRHLENVV